MLRETPQFKRFTPAEGMSIFIGGAAGLESGVIGLTIKDTALKVATGIAENGAVHRSTAFQLQEANPRPSPMTKFPEYTGVLGAATLLGAVGAAAITHSVRRISYRKMARQNEARIKSEASAGLDQFEQFLNDPSQYNEK